MVDGIKLPTGSITNIAITAGILLVGAVVVISAIKGIQKANPFGNIFGAEEKQQEKGGQQNDQIATVNRAEAEQTRADAEVGRLEAEIIRAEAEGKSAEAEFLRAQAELARADAEKARDFTERVKNEQEFIINQGLAEQQATTPKEIAVLDTQKEVLAIQEAEETTTSPKLLNEGSVTLIRTTGRRAGEAVQVSPDNVDVFLRRGFRLPTDATETKTDVASQTTQIVETSSIDPNERAIQTISSRNVSKKNSVFLNAPVEIVGITSDRGIDAKKIITGSGSSQQGTQAFIFKTKPKTLSDVLRQNPTFTASQARDFLNRSGTFATESDRRAFENKDFGTNTGSAPKRETVNQGGETTSQGTPKRTSESALRLEQIRAERKRDAILRAKEREKSRQSLKNGVNEV